MADQIEALQKLQVLDGKLYQLRRTLQEKPEELEQAREQVAAEETRCQAIEQRLKALHLDQKEQEGELQSREANLKKLQVQLLSLKTNKEYTTMQHEISTLKADNSILEETVLKVFDSIDQVAKERGLVQERLAKEQQRFREQTARVEQAIIEMQEEIQQFERQRQNLTPNVAERDLSLYERILVLREGLALVPLIDESCGGCNRRLPPQVVNEVYLKMHLVTCESCNRILYRDADGI